MVEDFITPSQLDKSTRLKKNQKLFNHTIGKMFFMDIYTMFCPLATEYTFFSAACRMFFKAGHIHA